VDDAAEAADDGEGRPMMPRGGVMPNPIDPPPAVASPIRLATGRAIGAREGGTAVNAGRIGQWIAAQATTLDDGRALLEGFCRMLIEAGVPLWSVSIGLPAINPSVRGLSYEWRRNGGATLVPATHDDVGLIGYAHHPVHALLTSGRTFARWRLGDDEKSSATFPMLLDLRAAGGTDYIQHLMWFAPGTALKGIATSFVTDAASGFADGDLALLGELMSALGLAICKFSLSRTLSETLATYLGSATSARVLEGHIRRGQGETVAAAIMLADFRAFTALTEREDPVNVVGLLDEHFDAVGEPVSQHGGEILKFIGDGFLAIFPVAEPGGSPGATCARALAAAEQALAANHALNARRRAAGLSELDVDLALHFGEVVYGNVGTSRRLDFTVIGRTVNETSRIEELCDEVGRRLLMSESFAARCGRQLEFVGTFALRGLQRRQRIWSMA
jgi:adenylate cyclase